MRRRRPLLVLLVFLPACSAGTAPPSLTAAERARLAAARLELTLGVGQHRASWPREDLVAALAQRRLFLRVDRLEAFVEPPDLVATVQAFGNPDHTLPVDRKSTRLNSSHSQISYAVFCLKKKKKTTRRSE